MFVTLGTVSTVGFLSLPIVYRTSSPGHSSSPLVLSEVCVVQSLFFCVVFSTAWTCYNISLFDVLITPLFSSRVPLIFCYQTPFYDSLYYPCTLSQISFLINITLQHLYLYCQSYQTTQRRSTDSN